MLRVSGEKKAETFREKLRIFKEKHTLLLLELLLGGKILDPKELSLAEQDIKHNG